MSFDNPRCRCSGEMFGSPTGTRETVSQSEGRGQNGTQMQRLTGLAVRGFRGSRRTGSTPKSCATEPKKQRGRKEEKKRANPKKEEKERTKSSK